MLAFPSPLPSFVFGITVMSVVASAFILSSTRYGGIFRSVFELSIVVWIAVEIFFCYFSLL
jgi:hypothetical protein